MTENIKDFNNWIPEVVSILDRDWKARYTEAERDIIAKVKEKLTEKSKVNILDYGCGTGRFCGILQRELGLDFAFIDYIGVDGSTAMIDKAKENNPGLPNASFFHVSEYQKNTDYDIVVSIDVIQHQENPLEYLEKIFAENPEADKIVIGWHSQGTKAGIIHFHNKYPFWEGTYSEADIEALADKVEASYKIYQKASLPNDFIITKSGGNSPKEKTEKAEKPKTKKKV
jgi:SAM-dependent methyltransferase